MNPSPIRRRIRGSLTTLAPLRIGGGGFVHREELYRQEGSKKIPININDAAVDHRERTYLPAAAQKGRLRALAFKRGFQFIEALFGSDDPDRDDAGAGKLRFEDALASHYQASAHMPPYWHPERWTGVAASVSLKRLTRTADHQKLLHYEYVPPGVTYDVGVTGRNISDDEIVEILAAFRGLEEMGLGAHTADGWGRCRWKLLEVSWLDREEVLKWVLNSAPTQACENFVAVDESSLQSLTKAAERLNQQPEEPACLKLKVTLNMESHFLVNDKSQTGSGEDQPDHAPRLTGDGLPELPAKSLRGALRCQAERILRTLADDGTVAPLDPSKEGPVYNLEHPGKASFSLAARLFGCNGWKSPLRLTPFRPMEKEKAGDKVGQEFLAVDRFTGGGAPGLKFNAQSFYKPVLEGTLSLDLNALARVADTGWPFGLLALTLRDLIEGDVTLGFGAAKGYGRTRAAVTPQRIPRWEELPPRFQELIDREALRELRQQLENGRTARLIGFLTPFVTQLEQKIKRIQTNKAQSNDNEPERRSE